MIDTTHNADTAYRKIRTVLIALTTAALVACVVGISLAATTLGGAERLGPLSEWVPGVLTACTLAFTLTTQHRIDHRQRASDLRQLEFERRQAEREQSAVDAERRQQAERVFVWLELVRSTYSADRAVVRWSNVSDGPAYLCRVTLILSDDSEESIDIGTMPPHHPLGEIQLPQHQIQMGRRPTPADRFPIGVRCEFRDAQGRIWRRDPAGRLSLHVDVEPLR